MNTVRAFVGVVRQSKKGSILRLSREQGEQDGSVFSGGRNGRKVWKKMRAYTDLADLVTQFSSDLEKI